MAGWAQAPAIPAYTRGRRLVVLRSTPATAGDAVGVELLTQLPLPTRGKGSVVATPAHDGENSEQVPRSKNAAGSGSWTRGENRQLEPSAANPIVDEIRSMTWKRALGCIEGAWRRSDKPDSAAYTAAIQACARYGKAEEVVRLICRMHSRRVRPDRSAYLALLAACSWARRWNWALTALREMKMLDLQPAAHGYRLAVQACCRSERSDRAESLVAEMQKQGLELDLDTYRCMAETYLEQDQYRAVKQLVFDMEAAGIQPDAQIYSSAMRACGRSGDWPSALIFLKVVRWEDATQDELLACVPVIDACTRSSSWEFALLVLDQVQPATANQPMGVATDAFVFAAAARSCLAGQQPELAEQIEKQKQAALDRAKTEVISNMQLVDRQSTLVVSPHLRRPLSTEARERLNWGLKGEPWTQGSERGRRKR